LSSVALGEDVIACNYSSIAIGLVSTASGAGSVVIGGGSTARSTSSIALGTCIVIGTDDTNAEFSLGIGLDETPRTLTQSHTMSVVGGKVGIGTLTPESTLDVEGDIYPAADNSYYLGKNSSISPKAFKGLILKDTTNSNYYRIEIISGTITATLI
jgi:hypothetical protein